MAKNPYKKMMANVKVSGRTTKFRREKLGQDDLIREIDITWEDLERKFKEQNETLVSFGVDVQYRLTLYRLGERETSKSFRINVGEVSELQIELKEVMVEAVRVEEEMKAAAVVPFFVDQLIAVLSSSSSCSFSL